MTASLNTFNLHALGVEELEQRILRDIRNHNFPALPPQVEALFFKSLTTQMDARRMGMEAIIPDESAKALSACLTALTENNSQQALILLTTLMKNLRSHYDQIDGIDTDPARAFLEDAMIPLLCNSSIQPPVRVRGFAELFTGPSYTPERPSYHQAIAGAANIFSEEKTKPWMMRSELSDHCITVMNAASYYHESDPDDEAEAKNQAFLAPIYALALQEWKDLLAVFPIEKQMEHAQPERFKHLTPELEQICNGVADVYTLKYPKRLAPSDFAQAVLREVP